MGRIYDIARAARVCGCQQCKSADAGELSKEVLIEDFISALDLTSNLSHLALYEPGGVDKVADRVDAYYGMDHDEA